MTPAASAWRTPSGPSYDDEFDGTSLDKTRWNAIVREDATAYQVADGKLTIRTQPGDIYTGDTSPPPNNFILQSADHAGADWVMETKMSGTINGGWAQGGLIAYTDGNNYVKFDPISDDGQTRINRIELRSETRTDLEAMVLTVLVEQVSELLGRSPEEIDPRYDADDDD